MQLNTLIGKKIYQKQAFLMDGTRIPLTGVVASGNIVTQIKQIEKEGYNSIQLGVTAKKRANKAILGHVSRATQASKTTSTEKSTKQEIKITPKYFKEVRVEDTSDVVLGSEIAVKEIFTPGDMIDVTGVSKGKGWAGGVKRYGFHGGPKTHGQSDRHRAPGSIGQGTTPGRVYKGKKMAGRMGSDTVTVKNLEIIEITDDGVLLVRGLVPGRVNSFIMVTKVGENKNFSPLYKEIVDEPVVEKEALPIQSENVEVQVESEVTQQKEVKIEEPVVTKNEVLEAKADEKAEIVSESVVKEVVEEKTEEEAVK